MALSVSRGGRGAPLVLCPGLLSTQADLDELIGLLRRDHDVVAFDLRGHGMSSAADRYTFEAFLGDLAAVVRELDLPVPPVLAGYSLGADLAVHYACDNPGTLAGLVLIDGANPVPEPFLTEADLPEFRAMWEDSVVRNQARRGTAHQVLLTARDILDLNLEIDAVRSAILDRYRRIDRPIRMIMSTSMAGDGDEGPAPRWNRNWHNGIERLLGERPRIAATRLRADHRLVHTHAADIARIIRDAVGDWGDADDR
ncbi:alpha/beta fold hydrolase [Nocardia wallacei]|uniref:alpha/beta fold hydrolase n=1 Tax=Nocardia wallacei TaxID=480035 RepID=UPI0024547AFF|nr:alpha/beta fold hydrolase [Nocardia wallacei]